MYNIVISVHYIISSLFIIIALTIIAWSIVGWIKRSPFHRVFNRLTYFFVQLLYLQLITGVSLYFFLKPGNEAGSISVEDAILESKLRFWEIEHISLMIFALILSQIGRFLMKELSVDWKKYRTASLYFGISVLVVLTSTAVSIFS